MDPEIRIVDWYRVDNWPRMRRVLIVGPALLSLGGLVMAVSFSTHEPAAVRAAAALVGMAIVASGAITTLAGMYRLLRDDSYLAIRTDGVAMRLGAVETLLPWADLSRARWDEALAHIVLERSEQAVVSRSEQTVVSRSEQAVVSRSEQTVIVSRRFAGVGGAALAERIERARRRTSMGMTAG
jgi:hypothetical protein